LEAFEGADGPVYWEDTQSQVAGQAGSHSFSHAVYFSLSLLSLVLPQTMEHLPAHDES
ncbi:hypothetical protein Tco_0410411, partial [Tanacetum coccineum]